MIPNVYPNAEPCHLGEVLAVKLTYVHNKSYIQKKSNKKKILLISEYLRKTLSIRITWTTYSSRCIMSLPSAKKISTKVVPTSTILQTIQTIIKITYPKEVHERQKLSLPIWTNVSLSRCQTKIAVKKIQMWMSFSFYLPK